jgi:hypothetical protein
LKVPVPFELVFPNGVVFLGVEPEVDFEARARGVADYQARDADGQRVWAIRGMDQDPEAARFGRSPMVKVKMAAAYQPVPPSPQAAGFNPLVAFEGLTVSPWRDASGCKPDEPNKPHRCGARLAYSMWATAMVDPAELGMSPA